MIKFGSKQPALYIKLFLIFALSFLLGETLAEETDRLLRISQSVDAETFDPAIARTIEDSNIIEQLFEGLTIYDPKNCSPIPGVAREWKISEDLKTYTFFLRSDAKWSDGSKVVAYDFLYAWKRILEPKIGSPWSYQLYNIKGAKDYYERKITDFSNVGITVLNDETLKVELEKPQPYFLGWLSHSSMSPVKGSLIEANGKDWTRPGKMISNGAFVLDYFEPKNKVILKKNGFYWDDEKVYLQELHFYPVEDENTGLKMYDTGMLEVDGGGLPLARMDVLKERKDIHRSNYLGVYFYRFNTTKEPFNNINVRKAFNLAVDKRVITDKILRGGQNPAYHLVPDGINWYLSPSGNGFNSIKARELLVRAGYCVKGLKKDNCKPFPQVEILFNTLSNHKNIAEAMQAMLKENLGLEDVKLINMDFKTVQVTAKQGNFQMVRGGWIGDYVDPMTFLNLWTKDSGNNLTGWSDPTFENLLLEAEKTLDFKKRGKILAQAEKILNENLPYLPIYFYVRIYLKKDFVRGYYENILDKHPLKYVYFSK